MAGPLLQDGTVWALWSKIKLSLPNVLLIAQFYVAPSLEAASLNTTWREADAGSPSSWTVLKRVMATTLVTVCRMAPTKAPSPKVCHCSAESSR